MLISELVIRSNNISDEDIEYEEAVGFFNDAIAEINVEVSANFPFLNSVEDEDYQAFPDKWQITMLIPFSVGRAKQKDSSQFEYNDAYTQFYEALRRFKRSYNIPAEYDDLDVNTSYPPVFIKNPYSWE